jgi:hypothetical protein
MSENRKSVDSKSPEDVEITTGLYKELRKIAAAKMRTLHIGR